MSRVGSKEIIIPDNVKVSIEGSSIFAEGPLGKLETKLHDLISTDLSENKISFSVKKESKQEIINPARGKRTIEWIIKLLPSQTIDFLNFNSSCVSVIDY